MGFYYYGYTDYDSILNRKYPWNKETILVLAKIERVISDSTILFTLNGEQYNDFIRMRGTFICLDGYGENRLFTFQPDDVVQIINNNYDDVHAAWKAKRDELFEQILEANEAEKERRKKEVEEEVRKQKEAEEAEKAAEAERMKHFWYRLFHKRKSDG